MQKEINMTLHFKGVQVACHHSWEDFITQEILKEITEIENQIGETSFTPSRDLVFRFLLFDLEKLKICVLGQDPYPQEGAATGRAFEDKRISTWEQTGENVSIRNILKLLHKHKNKSEKVSTIAEVRKDIENKKFNILGPTEIFDHWERQGVLLLNTALTCRVGNRSEANSHSIYWTCLTKKLIQFIDEKCPECHWFLWGEHAKKYRHILQNEGRCRMSSHPTINSEGPGDFLYENHFKNYSEINWINSKE